MPKNPFPAISVHDSYEILPDKSAKCARMYVLTNKCSKPINIATRVFTDKLDIRTENHSIINGSSGIQHSLEALNDGYSKVCYWHPSKIELAPDEQTQVTLTFDWPNFLPEGIDKPFPISYSVYDRKTYYSFSIRASDSSLVKKMILKDSTPHGLKIEFTTAGELCIDPVEISAGNRLFAKLAVASIADVDKELPLLKVLSSRIKGSPLADCLVILVQHLLGDFLPFVKTLESCGLRRENCYIIGIPYSTKDYVVRALKEQKEYANVFAPIDYPFHEVVEAVTVEVINRCKKEGKRFIVIEDGGYVIPLLHQKPSFNKGLKYCVGAVEQTKNGIWVDREIAKTGKLKIPVMSVAESKLKNEKEGKLIGLAVVSNIARLCQDFFREGVFQKKCLVIGLGPVGMNVCLALKAHGAEIYGYDSKRSRREDAQAKDIEVIEDITERIGEVALIIGGTGKSPINFDELVKVRHNTVFVNATSKRKEINYDDLEGLTQSIELIKGLGANYKTTLGKDFLLLANGYPVNFFDAESVPDKDIQFVPALLFKAAMMLFENGYKQPKIYGIPLKLQKEIEGIFSKMKDNAFVRA